MRRIDTHRLRVAWRKLRLPYAASTLILVGFALAIQWTWVQTGGSGTYAFGMTESRIGVGWNTESHIWQLYPEFYELPRNGDGSLNATIDTYFIDVSSMNQYRLWVWGGRTSETLYVLRAWMPVHYKRGSGFPESVPDLPAEEQLFDLITPWVENHWTPEQLTFSADVSADPLWAAGDLRPGWSCTTHHLDRRRLFVFMAQTIVAPLAGTTVIFAATAFFHAWRRRPAECRHCRYDLAGLPAHAACPECGRATRSVTPQPAPR